MSAKWAVGGAFLCIALLVPGMISSSFGWFTHAGWLLECDGADCSWLPSEMRPLGILCFTVFLLSALAMAGVIALAIKERVVPLLWILLASGIALFVVIIPFLYGGLQRGWTTGWTTWTATLACVAQFFLYCLVADNAAVPPPPAL